MCYVLVMIYNTFFIDNRGINMLVNLKEVLKIAQNENIAIGSFNIYNLETILALKEAVLKTKKPVIVAFGENYINYVQPRRIQPGIVWLMNWAGLTKPIFVSG